MNLYNTATKQKEEFKPLHDKKVGIYSCGPTVYWNQHIGHMYAYVQWDMLVRFLRYMGFDVKWVMNITDVGHLVSDSDEGEDKMEKGAKREGLSVWEIARKYEKQFLESLNLLNISSPDVVPRATEHIKEQIDLAKRIEDNGFAYKTKTGLVFDTQKFSDYSKFANLKLEEMESGFRVEVDKEKKNPWDFLLWVTNQPQHIMKWNSPWGEGFPGWHIECTAMSTKYLGEEFDIHTGGIEHIGVHHTNEIAQAYGAFGHQTAKYWIHNAWLTYEGVKMSKSLGNIFLVTDLIEKGFDPLALRYLALSSSYHKGLDFTFKSLESAQTAFFRLKETVSELPEEGSINEQYKRQFIEKLEDDLMVPEAMAIVWKLVKDSSVGPADKKATLIDFDKVLGLNLDVNFEKDKNIPEDVLQLAKERNKMRMEKNWAESDRLRRLILEKGYMVEDLKDDCKIRKIK
ncbi:MAG: cysteine--tRNA ligase [Candidatus Shapirobacteria bacterium]|nr:cysteine--tRNA ligase [Candidatus Shapirobacteria bacterium]